MATKKASASTTPTLPFSPRTPARPFVDPELVEKIAPESQATAEGVAEAYKAPATQSASNVTGDPKQNLQTFSLNDLALFTKEGTFSANASKDVHLFYVGRDDVHDILKYILSRVTVSLYLNMFGFDDSELNNILMEKALNPAVTMLITLDLSQAGGVHEKALLEADQKYNLAAYNTHFVIGQSATHQISHTKGFVADGRVAAEGSTNWSDAGEGTFVVNGQAGGVGYKAQNNTQSVITDPDTIIRFQTELIAEHMIAQAQSDKKAQTLKLTPATKALQDAAAAKQVAAKKAPAKKAAAKKAPARKSAAKKAAQ
jgi:phosphatidylserine/phosphatidylglycerophosphate/cardiolipin synthase-like enzyme